MNIKLQRSQTPVSVAFLCGTSATTVLHPNSSLLGKTKWPTSSPAMLHKAFSVSIAL